MLVLSRKPHEAITIGGDIVLTVLSITPGRVKIGIDAPATVEVDRQEVHEKRLAAPRDTAVLSRESVNAALEAARVSAEAAFDPRVSGYLSGVRGEDANRLLRRLAVQLGRALQEREEWDVRCGHADGMRDRET